MSKGLPKMWVTQALSEAEVVQALVFGQTLRRLRTKWTTSVIISSSLPDVARKALDSVFDVVVEMNQCQVDGLQNSEIGDELYCKMYCWNLTFAQRCIFVRPDMLILKNCDELMETLGLLSAFDKNNRLNTSVFVYDPSWQTFKAFLNLHSANPILYEFPNLIAKVFGKDLKPLDSKYYLEINPDELLPIIDMNDVAIVKLSGMDLKNMLDFQPKQNSGLWMNILRMWRDTLREDVQPLLQEKPHDPPTKKYINVEPIAIVGMGCRFPGANSLEEFWQLLIEGGDGIAVQPLDRMPPAAAQDRAKRLKVGYLKCPIDEFDGKFFGISNAELSFLDPQTRILTEVLWEALEDAAIDPLSLKRSNASIFTGAWNQDYKELINSQGIRPTKDFFRKYMGNAFGASSGRLSFILGVTGPNISTESGCSSSMIAISIACEKLRLGETQLALACGINLILHQLEDTDTELICAADGHCKTFDASADGYGRAEGCGVLVLKKYCDAIRDGDRIHAIIKGMGAAQEGLTRSLGTPTVECESSAMKMALNNAGIDPSEVSYIETHGTGTPVGDPTEIAAVAVAYFSKLRTRPIIVGSVKTNIGHTESCSGIAGIIKTVLCLQNEMIPVHRNFKTLNPMIDLDAVPAIIPMDPVVWPRVDGKIRYAGVSSFGITGTNAHAIIQEAPSSQPKNCMDFRMLRPLNILTISAKSEPALDSLLYDYKCFMDSKKIIKLADVAFTANNGRAHFNHRVAIIGKNCEEIASKIMQKEFLQGTVGVKVPKICFLFTGQGSQYIGMGKTLYKTSPVFKCHFDICEQILRSKFGISIFPILWGKENISEQQSPISRTIYSQTSIFCVEYCIFKMWEFWGVKPDCVLGHSLGECAAATAAGILNLEDALTLVAERSRLIAALPEGQMIVLRSNMVATENLLKQFQGDDVSLWLDVAAINSNVQTVLAGDKLTVEKFEEFCKNNKVDSMILKATHAFHSRHMDPMLQEYFKVASKVQYNQSTCKFISGMDGKLAELGQINSKYWVRQTRQAVQFMDACSEAYKEGCRLFVEIGPQPVLSALFMTNRSNFETKDSPINCLPSLRRNTDEWATILSSVAKLYVSGIPINWHNFDQFYSMKKVTLPNYSFQRQKHWFDWSSRTIGNQRPLSIGRKGLHPLVGCGVPNATSSLIYQGALDLHRLTYIKDHIIGDTVIFPGAGFLEMSMAAGHFGTQNLTSEFKLPSNPISLENLTIEAPLDLAENSAEGCQIQIIVTLDDSCGTNVTVFRDCGQEGNPKRWNRYSSAKYSPFYDDYNEYLLGLSENLSDLCKIRKRICKERSAATFYLNCREVGLNFGPTFQSIFRYWKNPTTGEVIAETQVPPDSEDYLCHPILIDNMLQAFIVNRYDSIKKLTVPVKIGKFVWFSKVDTPVVYVHCYPNLNNRSESTQSNIVAMYNSNGKLLVLMAGIVIVETSVSSVLNALFHQKLTCPPLYEDKWILFPEYLQNGPDLLKSFQQICTTLHPKFWIIFSGTANTAEYFKKQLQLLGRQVVIIHRNPKLTEVKQISERTYEICPYEASHLIAVLDQLKIHLAAEIEGIIYLWGENENKEVDQKYILEPFLYLSQQVVVHAVFKKIPKLFIITNGICQVRENTILKNPSPATLWGFARTLRNEMLALNCKSIDMDPHEETEKKLQDAFKEMWHSKGESQVALRDGSTYVPRMTLMKFDMSPLTVPPPSERFSLLLPASKAFKDLKFFPNPRQHVKADEVEVEIRNFALNFKDILVILKPTKEFETLNSVGIDFAGVISAVGVNVRDKKVGDSVFGCNFNGGAMPNFAVVDVGTVVHIPPNWTFNEAVALPLVFATAYFCIVSVAELMQNETILIHAAAGGVGLCAIQLAKLLGLKIMATAGSNRKRAYLKSLGIHHVFNSRTLEFEEQIKKATNGRGVDMVLNCLTGPGFKEASLNICAKGARFVEMSKIDVWKCKEVGLRRFDVKYTLVDLTYESKDTWRHLMSKMCEFMKSNVLKPIPYTRFDVVNVCEALSYLQKAKHIGKVIVEMPIMIKSAGMEIQLKFNLFNDQSTYVITGGLGGIGLEVAKWMSEKGAKHIVLVGRSALNPNSKASETMEALTKEGKHVLALRADVGDVYQCQRLLTKLTDPLLDLPPLRGIMHAAGSLDNALLGNQTWSKFESTVYSKVNGGWNLHNLTINYPLEHFVMFSSVVGIMGNAGQTNHSAGNAFLDALAFYRHSIGLPALVVNWGQWGQIGVAADIGVRGLHFLSPREGIIALEALMKSHKVQGCVLKADFELLRKVYPHLSPYLEQIETKQRSSNSILTPDVIDSLNFTEAFMHALDETGGKSQLEVAKESIEMIVRQILKIDASDEINKDQNILDIGMDSLMMVELRNSLQILVGVDIVLNPREISVHQTIQHLSEYVCSQMVKDMKMA